MRLAVVGAAGRTGAHVVRQALNRGHQVTAVARRPEAVATQHRQLRTVRADAFDTDSLRAAVDGADAVVSTLGNGSSRAPTRLYSGGVTNVLDAMATCGIRLIVVVSAVPVGGSTGHPALERLVLVPVLRRVFGPTYEDMGRMEELLGAGDLGWSALRPPRLVERPATGHYRLADRPLPRARSMAYADLATALLDAVGAPRGTVFIAG